MARLRYAYFANAAEPAARYGVSFDRVVTHLWRARRHVGRLRLHAILYMDDLVHAIACIDQNHRAWSDLIERYERALVRRCRNSRQEITATVHVRRLLAEVRRRSANGEAGNGNSANGSGGTGGGGAGGTRGTDASLGSYLGSAPLRNWLVERLARAPSLSWDDGGGHFDSTPEPRHERGPRSAATRCP